MKKTYTLSMMAFAFILSLSSPVFAELGYNKVTHKFYSIGANKKVDQNEYHKLIISIIKIATYNANGDANIATNMILKMLKKTKTHESKRILHESKNYQMSLLGRLRFELTQDELLDIMNQALQSYRNSIL